MGRAPHASAGMVYPGTETRRKGSALPCRGNAGTHTGTHSGSRLRAVMARLDLISQALLFGKLEADHRGREWKAVLQTCLNLFAERGSPGQSSGPEMEETEAHLARGLRLPVALPPS